MNNIIFEKVYQDDSLIELKITAESEFVTAYQKCYIEDKELIKISERICDYVHDFNTDCYLEFGKKEGNYTPAFSMYILPTNYDLYIQSI